MKAADIVGRLDFFGRGLELVGRENGGDFLRLWDRSKNYGLGVVVGREIDSRRTDWSVDRRRRNFGP